MARQYSDDIGSAAEGGELGPTQARWSPNLKRPWPAPPRERSPNPFATSSVGTFSKSQGVAISDFSGEIQRSQVANYIREQKYQEELDAWLREIREEAFVDIK